MDDSHKWYPRMFYGSPFEGHRVHCGDSGVDAALLRGDGVPPALTAMALEWMLLSYVVTVCPRLTGTLSEPGERSSARDVQKEGREARNRRTVKLVRR